MKFILFIIFLVSLTSYAKDTRKKIVVVDSGLNHSFGTDLFLCDDGHRDFTDSGLKDYQGHGTNIANIIVNGLNPSKYCIVIVKWVNPVGSIKGNSDTLIRALKYILYLDNVEYVNLSLSGGIELLNEYIAIKNLLNNNIIVAAAAGNDLLNLSDGCIIFPACYKFYNSNFHVVANYHLGRPSRMSNYGGPVTDTADGFNITAGGYTMSGTSQATAVFLNTLIKRNSR